MMRWLSAAGAAILLISFASASDLPKHTKLQIRLNETLSSESLITGMTFTGTLDKGLSVGEAVILPQGALVEGIVKDVDRASPYQARTRIWLELTSITTGTVSYAVTTNPTIVEGKPTRPNPTAEDGLDRPSRKAEAARIALDTIANTTIGAQSGNTEMVVLGPKSKLTFTLTSAKALGGPKDDSSRQESKDGKPR
jgi:hypothetical protein